jgi:hypothetical protein
MLKPRRVVFLLTYSSEEWAAELCLHYYSSAVMFPSLGPIPCWRSIRKIRWVLYSRKLNVPQTCLVDCLLSGREWADAGVRGTLRHNKNELEIPIRKKDAGGAKPPQIKKEKKTSAENFWVAHLRFGFMVFQSWWFLLLTLVSAAVGGIGLCCRLLCALAHAVRLVPYSTLSENLKLLYSVHTRPVNGPSLKSWADPLFLRVLWKIKSRPPSFYFSKNSWVFKASRGELVKDYNPQHKLLVLDHYL